MTSGVNNNSTNTNNYVMGSGNNQPNSGSGANTTYNFTLYTYNEKDDKWEASSKTFDENNPMSAEDWKKFAESGKNNAEVATFFEKWAADPSLSKLLSSGALTEAMAKAKDLGYIITSDSGLTYIEKMSEIIDRLRETFGTTGLEVIIKDGKLTGFRVQIDGKWETFGSDRKFSDGWYKDVTKEQQSALYYAWSMGYLPDEFMNEVMLGTDGVFGQRVQSEFGKDGTKLADDAKDKMGDTNTSFDFGTDGGMPEIDNPIMNIFSILSPQGFKGTMDAWAIGLMSMGMRIQNTVTDSIGKILNMTSQKDEFLFQKSLILNKKMFDVIRHINEQARLAELASHRKRRSIWDRIGDMFGKLFSGDVGGFFSDFGNIILDMTIRWITNLISYLIGQIQRGITMARLATAESSGDMKQVRQLKQQLKTMEMALSEMEHKLGGGDIQTGDYDRLSEEEMKEIEDKMNTLSDEEEMYLSYAELGDFVDMHSPQASKTRNDLELATDIMGGIAMGVLGLLTAGMAMVAMGPMMVAGALFISSAADKQQADAVIDARMYQIETEERVASMKHRSANFNALTEEVNTLRETLKSNIDLLGKDAKLIMTFVERLQDMLDTALTTMIGMEDRAASPDR